MPDPERLARVRDALRGNDADALVCALPCNVVMLTGYWPVIGSSLVFVTRDGAVHVLAPSDEEELARRAGLTEITTFEPGSLSDLRTLAEILAPKIKTLVRSMGLENATVAYESNGVFEPASYVSMHFFGDAIFEMLEDAFEAGTLIAADDFLARLRGTLTAGEVVRVREACRIASEAFDDGLRGIRERRTELAVADLFRRGLSPVERSGGHVGCMSGQNSARAAGAFAMSSARRLAAGDFVLVHCNSWLDGFWTDITRTYTLGPPDPKRRAVQKAIAEARAAPRSTPFAPAWG